MNDERGKEATWPRKWGGLFYIEDHEGGCGTLERDGVIWGGLEMEGENGMGWMEPDGILGGGELVMRNGEDF